jgi:hypothetical protein
MSLEGSEDKDAKQVDKAARANNLKCKGDIGTLSGQSN